MPKIKGWKKREYEPRRILWYNPSERYAIDIHYSPKYGWMVEYGSYEHKKLSEDWVSEIKWFKTKELALNFIYKFMRKF